MKKIILLFLTLLFVFHTKAQVSVSPQVIATAGSSSTISGVLVSWSVGEPLTNTISNSNYLITQGFQQPTSSNTINNIKEINKDEIKVSVFPNPTTDFINIEIRNNQKELKADLFDMNGKLLQSKIIIPNENNFKINMLGYALASYLFRIYATDDNTNLIYKIEKLK